MNQILNDTYIKSKLYEFNIKYNMPAEYIGINEFDSEKLYGLYDSIGNHQVRTECLLYNCNIYYDNSILRGTIRVSR